MNTPPYIQENVDISFLSAFKTGAKTRYFFDIITREDLFRLPEVFRFAKESSIGATIIGGGTNCLFAFDLYEGIIIRNHYTGYSEPYEEDGHKYIRVHSGEVTTTFALALYQHYGVSTLIPWVGLPGTMGGACVGNAGCFGLEMADMLVEATVLDPHTGDAHSYSREDMHYGYRESLLKGDTRSFVVDMLLDISLPEMSEFQKYSPGELQALRRLKQPPGLSCGSFFKNPKISDYHDWIGGKESMTGERGHLETFSAGKLIDDAGLKGMRVGGVHVSERHGNFFINDEKGTWQDILALRNLVKEKVREKHGIELHEEVRIIS